MRFERDIDPREKMRIGQAALPVVIHTALRSDSYTNGNWIQMGYVDAAFLLDNMCRHGISSLPGDMKFTLVHVSEDRQSITYSPEELIGKEVHYNGEIFHIEP